MGSNEAQAFRGAGRIPEIVGDQPSNQGSHEWQWGNQSAVFILALASTGLSLVLPPVAFAFRFLLGGAAWLGFLYVALIVPPWFRGWSLLAQRVLCVVSTAVALAFWFPYLGSALNNASVHFHIVEFQPSTYVKKDGFTAVRIRASFVNDGADGEVKRIASVLIGPTNIERQQNTDLASLVRSDNLSPRAYRSAPYYPLLANQGMTFTFTSPPLDDEFLREYKHGIVFMYADLKLYQKGMFGDRVVQDICLETTGTISSVDFCPER